MRDAQTDVYSLAYLTINSMKFYNTAIGLFNCSMLQIRDIFTRLFHFGLTVTHGAYGKGSELILEPFLGSEVGEILGARGFRSLFPSPWTGRKTFNDGFSGAFSIFS